MTLTSTARRPSHARDLRTVALRSSLARTLLGLLLLVAAMYLGGAAAPSVPVCATIALLALACTGVEVGSLRRDQLVRAAAVLIGVTVFQLVPLPPALLGLLDHRSAELSANALSPFRADRAAEWRPLHLDPGNGWSDLHYVVGLLAAYAASKQATRRGHGDALLTFVCLVPLWIACLGIAHKLWDVEKLYGLYTPRDASPAVMAPLLNANHLSAYAGAGAILWAGRAMQSTAFLLRVSYSTASTICAAVCVLSASRGGALAALGGFGLLLFGTRLAQETSRRKSAQRLFTAAGVASAVVVVAAYMGWEVLRREYRVGGVEKFKLIGEAIRALRGHWVFGVGAGGLHAAVTSSGRPISDYTLPRAESLPVDLALAIGPIAAGVVLALAARWLWSVRPTVRGAAASQLAAFCALVSLAVHDLVDYSLWLGATGYLAAVLAGLLAGQRAPSLSEPAPAPGTYRTFALLAAAASVAAGIVTARSTLDADRDQWLAVAASRPDAVPDAALRAALSRHPGDPYLPLVGASMALRTRDPRALRFVNRAMALAPNWAQPHATLARVLAARGLRSQAIVEVRIAAGLSERTHGAVAVLLVALRPAREEIVRAVPDGARGLAFLRVLGSAAIGTPAGPLVDAVLLERAPGDLEVLVRDAGRAREAHDVPREIAAWERVISSHPGASSGYLGMVDARLAAGDLVGADTALRRCLERAGSSEAYLSRVATVRARRGDTPGMRRAMQQLMDSTGGDIDRRIDLYGQLGDLELSLRHEGAALAAYERADSMAFPRHPYIDSIVRLAHQLNDVPRLRGACGTLRDNGPLNPAQLQACNGVTGTAE